MRCQFFLFLFPLAVFSQLVDRPNVVLFMADDMGMGDSSAYQFFTGNSDEQQIHTPAMQKLANMGMLFHRCPHTILQVHAHPIRITHGQISVESPNETLGTLWRVQGDPLIEEDRPTLATLFRSCGYATAIVGKWHLGLRYTRTDGRPAAGWGRCGSD